MAGEWRETTFQQLLDEGLLEIGDGYRAQNNELGGAGPIFLRAGHVTDTHIDFAGVEHFHADLADKVRSKMSKVGDTIITTKGNSTGRTSFVTDRLPSFVYSPHLSYWRSRDPEKLCGGFLRYWSRGKEFVDQLSGMKASTDMAPYLSLTDQRRLSITLPSPPEQKSIAKILGALDDKIELNRQMNATLEAMARLLFESWFVDFDPVRAKVDGRQPAALDTATADLFPGHFDHTHDVLRPQGWTLSRLGDHADLVRGNTYKSKLKDLPGPYLLGLGSIKRNGGFRDDSLRTYGGESAPKLVLRPGDLFASLKDVTQAADLLGAVARVPAEIPAGRLTQDTVKLVARDSEISFAYLYHALLRLECREYCRGRATGTTNLGLSREDFLGYPLLVPTKQVQNAFDAFDSQIESKIANNRIQSRTLATLRDTLLPKLLSGEIQA